MEKTFYVDCPNCGKVECVDFKIGIHQGYNEAVMTENCSSCNVDFITHLEVRIQIKTKMKDF